MSVGVHSRVTMPENFYDITSDMLLATPDSQYLLTDLYLGALGASLEVPAEFGLPGRGVGGAGAPYRPEDRDRLMLANPMFREVIAAAVNFQSKPGNTVRINRPVFENTTYTEAARRITTAQTVSTTPISAHSQQVDLTLYRYGGPFDSVHSRIAPIGIDSFDATFGVHRAASIYGSQLRRDFHRFIHLVNLSLLDLASTVNYPTEAITTDDGMSTASFPFSYAQLVRLGRDMDNSDLPTFGDGHRALLLTPTQLAQLRLDATYRHSAKEFPQYNILFPTYVASVNKFHIFEVNTLAVQNNSSSIPVHYGVAICPGALLAGMGGEGVRVRPSTNDNYGMTALNIWTGDLAFGLSNDTFVVSVRSTTN